jgi:Skp family chaperone for outer membrane proteins
LQRAQADFQRIQMSYSQMEQQRTGELAEKEAGLNTQIKDQMDVALKQLAEEKGYDLVLVYETNVLYGSDKLDVTQELADVLNKMDRPEPKKVAPKK